MRLIDADELKPNVKTFTLVSDNICSYFCNYHCCSNDCPDIQIDKFENRYDLSASEIGLERQTCGRCRYNDKHCGCEDCLFVGSKECPKMDGGDQK